ncbi:MAG: hypothetical protein EP297_11340 [Gammaproteobacteria bacterium]|nr:MAG: hypothetical protein EP297_11340 [Gammaproteobacteria bacterium]
MRTITAFAIIIIMLLGYGYWQVNARGWFHAFLRDTSDNDLPGRIYNAQIKFMDKESKVLANAKTDNRHGAVYLSHPTEGYCVLEASQQPMVGTNKEKWKKCHEMQSRWVMQWANKVHSMEIVTDQCHYLITPITLRKNLDDWWLWWIPHPHIGGTPYTSFDVSIMLDNKRCKIIKTY